MSKLE